MFWGSFHGNTLPLWREGLDWSKGESYCERIVSLIEDYLKSNPHPIVIQNSAPGMTREELARCGIQPIC